MFDLHRTKVSRRMIGMMSPSTLTALAGGVARLSYASLKAMARLTCTDHDICTCFHNPSFLDCNGWHHAENNIVCQAVREFIHIDRLMDYR